MCLDKESFILPSAKSKHIEPENQIFKLEGDYCDQAKVFRYYLDLISVACA
jgi:hypothetical protein